MKNCATPRPSYILFSCVPPHQCCDSFVLLSRAAGAGVSFVGDIFLRGSETAGAQRRRLFSLVAILLRGHVRFSGEFLPRACHLAPGRSVRPTFLLWYNSLPNHQVYHLSGEDITMHTHLTRTFCLAAHAMLPLCGISLSANIAQGERRESQRAHKQIQAL